jgi:acetylornithine deacetylase/succinyl-diaminopimelate desuccinylase-like protein
VAELCAQPSVSAAGEGMAGCARLVARHLEARGLDADIIETARHPAVVAEGGSGDRTLLFYNHYDVQPPEPLELWETPPFEPNVRDGKLFARGAVDDKGHFVTRLAALDAYRALHGELPFRVAFLIEGEEEIGSPSLEDVVARNRTRLAGDGCIWETGGVDEEEVPVAALGVRGVVDVELTIETARVDAHSGEHSYLPNAAWRLVWALATLKGPDERILIDGFYDDVAEPSRRQLELLAALPSRERQARQTFGVRTFAGGLTGARWNEYLLMPTCTINGLSAGFEGDGSMMIIPARATAKIDFRLLPGQDPADVVAKLRRHLDAHGFDDVAVARGDGTRAAAADPDHPFVRLCAAATREVYGVEPVLYPYAGGSGPVELFLRELTPAVMDAGLAYPGCCVHAPNEHFRLEDFRRGTMLVARILERFAQQAT